MKGTAKPTAEEVEKKAKDALEATDVLVQKQLLGMLAYAAPFAMQSQRVVAAVDQRFKLAQEKALRVAYEENK